MKHFELMKKVAVLPELSTPKLRAMWIEYHDSEPPPFNRSFLVKRLAYRLQELAYGGMSQETKKRLEALDAEAEQERKPTKEQVLPGTRLIREWKGEDHVCTVLEDGFEYGGRRFKSLTAVANFITGSRWNGHVFWGLRKQKRGTTQ
ncbi:conserved hypothetical protein [Magnetococcus marinus MC-1]|uniref:Bacteriophage-related protein n=1 Tax=Magnetococcus marinus (strain ATCC BAA-1437 / JCM 17883 / MC-1) TaxID=156889 RepID=A0L6Z6_MAGMM|nr:DUF2924 domain-containing protein [Magnetococcus marinus]ABK43739.1 conserved hypothetical protein [Magnetococcus marinus MC-1]